VECGYLNVEKGTDLIEKCKQVGRLLGGMMEKAELFCGKPNKELREDGIEYEIHPSDAN
jgi:hypothetical protein